MPLIRDGNLVQDDWVQLPDDAPLEANEAVIVSVERWQRERETLGARSAPVGVRLRPDQPPSELADDLDRFETIALEFPVFKDGRGFSYARLLRERYGYRGDVRAFGHILQDQYLYLDRCGVNVVEVKDEMQAAAWSTALNELSVSYQPAADTRQVVSALRRENDNHRQGNESNLVDDHDGPDPQRVARAGARVRSFSHAYGHLPAQKLLAAMIEKEFSGSIALVSSFGAEAAVLLHMVSGIEPSLPIIFLDTGKIFGETLRYRDSLVNRLSLTDVRSVQPEAETVAKLDPDGMLWQENGDACCAMRKVEPLERALKGLDAWITGRKRYQGQRRAVLPVIEALGGRIKINPLASWTRDLVDEYFMEHKLPHHPLQSEGYQSIGCMPCTDRVVAGEDFRAGRWRGSDKTECGIHETPAGQSLTSSGL